MSEYLKDINKCQNMQELFYHVAVQNVITGTGSNVIMRPVTHYTSVKGFCGIIESKQLWATRLDCLNDYSEGQEIVEAYKRVVQQLSREDSFYKKFENMEFQDYFFSTEKVREDMLKTTPIQNPEIYIISFSQNDDSLSMWNYYIKNDKYEGFALNFGHNNPEESFKTKPYEIKFIRIFYDVQEVERKIQKVLTYIKKLYIEETKTKQMAIKIINNLIFELRYFYKNPHFKHEEEYRIMIVQSKDDRKFAVKYRNKGQLIIPYIEVPLKELNLKLVYVTIPPIQNKNKIVEQTTEEFLESHGFKNKAIKLSTIPVRY